MRAVVVGVVCLLAACDHTDDGASVDAAGADDAMPVVYPACSEFDAQGTLVPAHVDGALTGADITSPAACAVTNAPYGSDSAGPDRVVPLHGLRTGSTYVVKLVSTSDLQFYVTTGCGTPSGPGADQCLLFEDESLAGVEVGRFVATGSSAYVVVDFFASQAPPSVNFTLDVYAEECAESSECGASRPACSDGQCVECVTSFDCSDSARPRCDAATHTCVPGDLACAYGDDGAEPFDDGPSGARVLALDAGGRATASGSLCSSAGEADFVAFDVTTLGETWDFQLAWSGGRDLDVELFDGSGRLLGASLWEHPERARLTYLPLGRYYVRATELSSSADPAPVSYTVLAQRTLGPGCASAADCASEYRNQIFRGSCDAGACIRIEGDGAVAEGGACDSESDCGSGLRCPSFFYVANGDTRETCSRSCGGDGDCDAGFVCTSYLASNFCVAKCSNDDQCPTYPGAQPLSGPWLRLSCDVPSGRCLP